MTTKQKQERAHRIALLAATIVSGHWNPVNSQRFLNSEEAQSAVAAAKRLFDAALALDE